MSIVIFILILSFLVIIHELGHYVAARWQKIRVEEFGLGYPPKALTLFKRWGTVFTLNWVPFGGFVKLEGEEGGPETDDSQSVETTSAATHTSKTKSKRQSSTISFDDQSQPFYAKSAPGRLLVILAGALVNFVYGVLAFTIVFSLSGIPSGAIIDSTAEGSPAQIAGVPAQTAITAVTVDGQEIAVDSSLAIIQIVQQYRGQEVMLLTSGVCQDGQCKEGSEAYQVYVRTAEETPADQGALGVTFKADYYRFYPWYEMPVRGAIYGTKQALMLGWQILLALQTMVTQLISTGGVPQDLTGPVGIVHEANRSGLFSQGPIVILFFSGMLSINLAIMNVLPIPALDGGRAVFILLEQVVGKRRVQRVEGYANYGGMVILVGLILLITARDIFRVVTGG